MLSAFSVTRIFLDRIRSNQSNSVNPDSVQYRLPATEIIQSANSPHIHCSIWKSETPIFRDITDLKTPNFWDPFPLELHKTVVAFASLML